MIQKCSNLVQEMTFLGYPRNDAVWGWKVKGHLTPDFVHICLTTAIRRGFELYECVLVLVAVNKCNNNVAHQQTETAESLRSVLRQCDHQRWAIDSRRQVELVATLAENTVSHNPCETPSGLLFTHTHTHTNHVIKHLIHCTFISSFIFYKLPAVR